MRRLRRRLPLRRAGARLLERGFAVRKCTFCIERQQSRVEEAEIDGRPLAGAALERHQSSFRTPACAKACPSGTLQFGERDELLAEAKRRIAIDPGKYVDHVYGEKEAGGTGWLYLAAVPFDQLGFPMKFENLDAYEKLKVGAAQPRRPVLAAFWNGLGALAGGACWFFRRREEVRAFEDRGES
jgi:formate dehydrogenase iron-sulfur subunit